MRLLLEKMKYFNIFKYDALLFLFLPIFNSLSKEKSLFIIYKEIIYFYNL